MYNTQQYCVKVLYIMDIMLSSYLEIKYLISTNVTFEVQVI